MSHLKDKAQAAVEYMMNYSWLLLTAGFVGATLFSLYGGGDLNQSASGFNDDRISIEGVSTSEDGLTIQAASRGDEVEVREAIINDGEEERTIILDSTVSSSSDLIEICGVTESSSEDLDVSIVYDTAGLENLETSGTIENTELSDCFVQVSVTLLDDNNNSKSGEYQISVGEDIYIYGIEGPPGIIGRVDILDSPEDFAEDKNLDIEIDGGVPPGENQKYAMVSVNENGKRQDLYEDFLISDGGSILVEVGGEETVVDFDLEKVVEVENEEGVLTVEPFSCTITQTGCEEN